jgi:hypothetical protein
MLIRLPKRLPKTISKRFLFLRTMVDNVEYGFDLNLYAEIDEQNVTGKINADVYSIVLKKKVIGIWPRLLTSIIRVTFLFLF